METGLNSLNNLIVSHLRIKQKLTIHILMTTDGDHGDGFSERLMMNEGLTASCQ